MLSTLAHSIARLERGRKLCVDNVCDYISLLVQQVAHGSARYDFTLSAVVGIDSRVCESWRSFIVPLFIEELLCV
jgi:hypothetical protein